MGLYKKGAVVAKTGFVLEAPEGTSPMEASEFHKVTNWLTFGADEYTLALATPTFKIDEKTITIPQPATQAKVEKAISDAGIDLNDVIVQVDTKITLWAIRDMVVTGGTKVDKVWRHAYLVSREDLPKAGGDDPETESIGTWQIEVMDTVETKAATSTWEFTAQELSPAALGDYYGGGTAGTGYFDIPSASAPKRKALMVVMQGNGKSAGVAYRSVSVSRNGGIEPQTDKYIKVPLKATINTTPSGTGRWYF